MENRGCLSTYKNCDDSWVVTTEGPRGPKCTKSAGALIGLSAWNEHRGSRVYERRGSAGEYWDSEKYEHWGSTRRVGRA